MSIYRYWQAVAARQTETPTSGQHQPDQATSDGGPWCKWCPDIPHRSRAIDALCPSCADDPATRALWETAMAEADMRRRERENGAA